MEFFDWVQTDVNDDDFRLFTKLTRKPEHFIETRTLLKFVITLRQAGERESATARDCVNLRLIKTRGRD